MMRHLCAEHAETTRPGDVFIAERPVWLREASTSPTST